MASIGGVLIDAIKFLIQIFIVSAAIFSSPTTVLHELTIVPIPFGCERNGTFYVSPVI
jgi:formylmethanofuran dehydrogenase subunit B